MLSESMKVADLINDTVSNRTARMLLYQARVNYQLFKQARLQLEGAFEALIAADFSRSQTCHMNDGVFGATIYTAKMMQHKEEVLCFLVSLLTSGYRFIRSISSAQRHDKATDWAQFRRVLNRLEDQLRIARNAMEHVDEALAKGQLVEDMEYSFSRHAILSMKTDKGTVRFDFSPTALEKISVLYPNVLAMLERRQRAMGAA